MIDKIILWILKHMILLWDRHGDKLAYSFGKDERTDYSVIVERFYDDYYTVGTEIHSYEQGDRHSSGILEYWGVQYEKPKEGET